MTENLPVVRGSGGFGGGGGGSSGASIAPDTLFSKAYAIVMDILSEGPIDGIANGSLNSVQFNNTPVASPTGAITFNGLWFSQMNGTSNQPPVQGIPVNDLSDTAYTTELNVQVTNGMPGPITQAIADAEATSVYVVLGVAQLYSQDKSGNVTGTSVNLQILTRCGATSPWITVFNDTISGKTSSEYQRTYRVSRPSGAGDWEIQVVRATADYISGVTGGDTLVNNTYWYSYTVCYDGQFQYPNTSYIVFAYDSQYFGSSVPSRKYLLDGRIIQIPSNYDPHARTYAGVWDGTFQQAWSNNPAWVWYDLITHPRYGAGTVINPNSVDKWGLYAIAQFCDEPVPDGAGGSEPRYTFNGVLNTADDALKALQTIAAMFDAIVFANGTSITCLQDQGTGVPKKLVTNANVLGGNFEYQGTSLATRPTVARVSLIDPAQNYAPSVEVVDDPLLTAKWGYIPQDIQTVGCTSRGQAARKGLNAIELAWGSGEIVTYTAGLDHADLLPGDFILVGDAWYQGIRLGGRVRIIEGFSGPQGVAFDSVIDNSSENFFIWVAMPDGTVSGPIACLVELAPDGLSSLAYLVEALPYTAPANSVWLMSIGLPGVTQGELIEPRLFRVLTVTEKSSAAIEVQAAFYDTTRLAFVDYNIRTAPSLLPNFSGLSGQAMLAPTNVFANDYVTGAGTTTTIVVTVSWTPSADPRVAYYNVRAVQQGGPTTTYKTSAASLDIPNLPIQYFIFGVQAVSLTGITSAWADSELILVNGQPVPPGVPQDLAALGGIRQIQLSWLPVVYQPPLLHYEVWRSGDTIIGDSVFMGNVNASAFTDTDSVNLQAGLTWFYWVRAVTTMGVYGDFAGPVAGTVSTTNSFDYGPGSINSGAIGESQVTEMGIATADYSVAGSPTPTPDFTALACDIAVTDDITQVVVFWSVSLGLYDGTDQTSPGYGGGEGGS